MSECLLGFDVGGTKCAVILGKADRDAVRIVDRTALPTPAGPEATLAKLEAAARQLLSDYRCQPKAIGISCGGPLDSRRGVVLGPPNLPGWHNVAICERFTKVFGVTARLQNDANACAVAEWKWGAARGTRDAVFLTFGTGMGSGIIIGGRLHAGPDDLHGEAGHVRLAEDGPVGFNKAGSFEGFCSGGGIIRLAQSRIRAAWQKGARVSFCAHEEAWTKLEVKTVAEAARSGDGLAREVFETSAFYLGRGLAILVDILTPEVTVIGSVFARCEDLLRPTAVRVLTEEALPAAVQRCRIVPAGLGDAIGDFAALAVALADFPGAPD